MTSNVRVKAGPTLQTGRAEKHAHARSIEDSSAYISFPLTVLYRLVPSDNILKAWLLSLVYLSVCLSIFVVR